MMLTNFKKYESLRNHAVVIGGSIAGLLAARVLKDFFSNVTIIERDQPSEAAEPRRGVPHGRHAHGLLAGGLNALESLFPGFTDEAIAAGAEACDPLYEGRWYFEGGHLRQARCGGDGIVLSRPLLEHQLRQRVSRIDGIQTRTGVSVRQLVTYGNRVTGLKTDEGELMVADLVVDATGRGSKSPSWLRDLAFPAPSEEKVEVQLAYTTRIFKRRPNDLGTDKVAVVAPTPLEKRGGVIIAQESGCWMVTLFGHFGVNAPVDLKGFINFAKELPAPDIYDVIRDAEALDDACTIRYLANTRRRYEKLGVFPRGFLVFGDAICSFNPIYGQGMTVAAMQAKALRECLEATDRDLSKRFFKRASRIIDNPWNIAVGADLRIPETPGRRSLSTSLINRYITEVHRCAHTDPVAARAFIRVAQFLEEPASLMKPAILLRVLSATGRRILRGKKVSANQHVVTRPARSA